MGDSLLLGVGKDQAKGNLSQLDDPWNLPPYFLLTKNEYWKSLRTYSGYWKEKEEELIAIRSAGESSSSSSGSPSYVGVRKTLEFYLKDGTRGGEGTRTDWIIHEYHHLRDESSVLFLEEDLVVCKVFKKDAADHDSCGELGGDCTSNKLSKQDTSAQLGTRTVQEDLPCAANIDSVAAWDARVKPDDDVWQHFTKICTDDPDVVYAACHHCDKVLKAHPKKHGISQLKRHKNSNKCRSSFCNPSSDEDWKILHHLRAVLDHYKQHQTDGKAECEEVNVHHAQLDPWDPELELTPLYVTSSFNRQTHGGFWKEIKKEFTAIRMNQSLMQGGWKDIHIEMEHMQMHVPQPQYMGLRRTLQFHHQDGRKTDWIMFEYQQLDDNKSPALFLQGGMVIRKVFRYDKDAVASAFSKLNKQLNADDDNGEGMNADIHGGGDRKRKRNANDDSEGMNTDITTISDNMDTVVDRKGKKIAATPRHKSEVWMHFTKIYNTGGVVYAVCHSCDRGYSSGRSTNGTSHLRRHNKSCTSKHCRTGLYAEVNKEMLTIVNTMLRVAAEFLTSKNKTVCRNEWLDQVDPQDEDDQNV